MGGADFLEALFDDWGVDGQAHGGDPFGPDGGGFGMDLVAGLGDVGGGEIVLVEDPEGAGVGGVVFQAVAFGVGGIAVGDGEEFGVAGFPGLLVDGHGFEAGEEGGVAAVEPGLGPGAATGVEVDGHVAGDEAVGADDVVVAAADEDAAVGAFDDVVGDEGAAGEVVEIDGVDVGVADVVKVVGVDVVAALGPVATHIEGADVVGFHGDGVDVVVVDAVFVAGEENGEVGRVVDGVAGDLVADPFEVDGGRVGAGPAAEVVDVIAAGEVVGGGECWTVAAVEFDGAIAGIGDFGVFDAVVPAALDD